MINYQTWLENPEAIRVLLIKIDNVLVNNLATTFYLSTAGITVSGISNIYPIVKNSVDITESISLDYKSSISFGDIEIANNNGEYDSWLNYIWVNKPVTIYYGGLPNIPNTTINLINDMQLIFSGIIEDIDSKSLTTLNLKIRDKLEKLNYPITEQLLGNYWHGNASTPESSYLNQYRNNIKPLVFGEVHNITPLLTDASYLEYMVCNGTVEQIIEVLDNGVPVQFYTVAQGQDPLLPAGSFRLANQPVGTVTASVQGISKTINIASASTASTYTNTVSNTIATILKLYGKQLGYDEIDVTTFAAYGSQPIGIYINDRANLLTTCQELAKSCNLILSVTREGKVNLIPLTIPTSATVVITKSSFILNTLKINQKPQVISGIKLGHSKNWTILTGLVTGIPEEHKNLFAQEYIEISKTYTSVQQNYNTTVENVLEGTYLISDADATSIATSRLDMFSVQRKTISMTCTSKFMDVRVGTPIQLYVGRFGITDGVYGRVISTKPNWIIGKIDLEILV